MTTVLRCHRGIGPRAQGIALVADGSASLKVTLRP